MRHIIKKILKEETNNFELVKNLIYTMFDNVRFVEYVAKRNEVMIYYTNRDNRQMLIPTEICDMITKYTGLNVVPWYEYGTKKYGTKNNNDEPDFYIDTEEYDEELNENYIPESKETTNEVEKNLEVINLILTNQINWDGLCDIWVEYNEDENLYEIRSKTTRSYFEYDEIEKELDYLENTLRSMRIRPYIYTPWYILDCEDEVKFLNEQKEETNYLGILKDIVSPFKEDECVCDIDMWYDDEDGRYSVYLIFGTEELNDKFTNDGKYLYIRKKIMAVKETIKSYLPIDNLFVGSYGKPNCGWESINESKKKSKKDLIERVLNDLVLPQYEHVICGFEIKNVDDESLSNVINYPSVTVTFIGGKGTKLYPQTPGIQKMYDDLLDEVWDTVWDYTGISLALYSKHVKDCGKENIYLREQKEETYDMSPLERTVADFVNMSLSEYKLPEAFYKVVVDVFDDNYGREECTITSLFEKPFKLDDSDRMHFIMGKIKRDVNDYFGNVFSHIAFGSSTVSNYNDTRDWYSKRKNKKLNESDESKQEKKFKKLLNTIEEHLNSNSYDSVVRFMVDYDEVMDDVIVNIFFDFEESVRLGLGINPVIKKTGKKIMEDLSIFPFDFKYYVHFDKRQLTESDNKKKSLIKNIRDVGIYDFIRMTGIELTELQSQIGQIPREMLEQFIKDHVSNEGLQYSSAKPDEKLISIDIVVRGNEIVDFIYYDGKFLSFEITEYANGFSKEETDQYIESSKNYEYNTIFNIANKISRKIS